MARDEPLIPDVDMSRASDFRKVMRKKRSDNIRILHEILLFPVLYLAGF